MFLTILNIFKPEYKIYSNTRCEIKYTIKYLRYEGNYKFRNNNTDQNNMEIERSGYGTMWKIEENREIQRKINIMVYQGDWENDGNNIFK